MTSSWAWEDLAQSSFNIFTVVVEVSQICEPSLLILKLLSVTSYSQALPFPLSFRQNVNDKLEIFEIFLSTFVQHNAASQQNIPKFEDKYVIMEDWDF